LFKKGGDNMSPKDEKDLQENARMARSNASIAGIPAAVLLIIYTLNTCDHRSELQEMRKEIQSLQQSVQGIRFTVPQNLEEK
jgi:hypothetical protein